jgi:hypothetical protein
MRDRAIITTIKGTDITVVPLITDACMSCHDGCAKQGHPFTVINPHNFEIARGTVVKIGTSVKTEIFQGLFSLCFPIACAVAGYYAADPLALCITGHPAMEGMHAGCVLAGLLSSSLLVFLSSRFIIRLVKPEITAIF